MEINTCAGNIDTSDFIGKPLIKGIKIILTNRMEYNSFFLNLKF